MSYMNEFAIISKKSGWMFVGEIFRKKNYSGNKSCVGISLNSCFLSIPYSLDIYAKKHKVLWNINGTNYIGIHLMVFSQKSLVCAHKIDQKAVLKKKKGTRKDTENVRCVYFMGQFVNLYSVENSNVLISFPGFLSYWVMKYDREKPGEIGCQYL